MPEIITATYQIVTPMFIGDAEQKANSIAPAAVKGALRFWWRALNWGCIRKNSNSDEQALRELHRRESELFGSASETGTGQAKFLLRVEDQSSILKSIMNASTLDNSNEYNLKTSQWQSYLLGQGLMSYDKTKKQNLYNPIRTAISEGKFTIKLLFRTKNETDKNSIEQALLAWGLLGGLGSRNRRGIGSVAIQTLTGSGKYTVPQDREGYIQFLDKLKNNVGKDCPPFTAFSQQSILIVSEENTNKPWKNLGIVAKEMQLYRGWGYANNGVDHKINGITADPNRFPEKESDHKLVYDIANQEAVDPTMPESCIFGLPRIYNLSKAARRELKIEPVSQNMNQMQTDSSTRSRRASPLFIHAHQFPDSNNTLIAQLLLPATFLPPNDIINLGRDYTSTPPSPPNWGIIKNYLKQSQFSTWQEVTF